MEHTPEPWQFKDSSYVAAKFLGKRPNGEVFFNTRYRGVVDMTEEQDIANARRIVACVNACKGIDTERLERYGVGGIEETLESAWEISMGEDL